MRIGGDSFEKLQRFSGLPIAPVQSPSDLQLVRGHSMITINLNLKQIYHQNAGIGIKPGPSLTNPADSSICVPPQTAELLTKHQCGSLWGKLIAEKC